jgi:cytochrome c oxidase assembly protein subunit 15
VNFFENAKTVQFMHRSGAYLVFLLALWHVVATWVRLPGTTHARRALLLFLLVSVQAAIGIFTLIRQVPLDAALAHQAMALIVLGFAAAHWRGTKGSYPLPTAIAVRS